MKLAWLLLTFVLIGVAGACSGSPQGKVTVLAASSLQGPLEEIADDWTQESGIAVEISYAGSQTLAAQLRDGFPADVAIVASENIVRELSSTSDLSEGPIEFAMNEIVVAFAADVAPVRADQLAGSDLVITLADPVVPLGGYTVEALQHAGIDIAAVRAASLETSAAAVVTRLRTGDADAAVIYATDAGDFATTSLGGTLATYFTIALSDSGDASALLVHLSSPAAHQRLLEAGFLLP